MGESESEDESEEEEDSVGETLVAEGMACSFLQNKAVISHRIRKRKTLMLLFYQIQKTWRLFAPLVVMTCFTPNTHNFGTSCQKYCTFPIILGPSAKTHGTSRQNFQDWRAVVEHSTTSNQNGLFSTMAQSVSPKMRWSMENPPPKKLSCHSIH